MRVAVMEGVAHQLVVTVEQGEVHTPGIQAQAAQGCHLPRFPQAGLDLGEQAQDIPMQVVPDPHRAVGEAVGFLQGQAAGLKLGQHHPPAAGPQIDGGKAEFSVHIHHAR